MVNRHESSGQRRRRSTCGQATSGRVSWATPMVKAHPSFTPSPRRTSTLPPIALFPTPARQRGVAPSQLPRLPDSAAWPPPSSHTCPTARRGPLPAPTPCPTARRGPLPAPTPARQCGVAPPSSHACPTAQRAPSCGRSDQHTNELCCCRYFTLSSGVKVRGDAGECLLLLRRYYHRVPEDAQGLTFKRQEPKKGELFVVNSCELCGQAASYQPSQHPPVHCIAQPPAAHFIT